MPKANTKESIMEKVVVSDSGCWEWTGLVGKNGYPSVGYKGKRARGAHRISFMLHKGEIPDGLFVCHTCDNKLCLNPGHLFLGTAKQNSQDMVSKGRANNGVRTKLTHCKRGHEFTEESVQKTKDGDRYCKICVNNARRAWRANKKAARATQSNIPDPFSCNSLSPDSKSK